MLGSSLAGRCATIAEAWRACRCSHMHRAEGQRQLKQISILEKERDKYSSEANDATAKHMQASGEASGVWACWRLAGRLFVGDSVRCALLSMQSSALCCIFCPCLALLTGQRVSLLLLLPRHLRRSRCVRAPSWKCRKRWALWWFGGALAAADMTAWHCML